MELIKKIWGWIKSFWFIGSNLVKILEEQNKIKTKLNELEQAIKSPQYQVAELEKIKLTIDLVKENNEQEKIMLQRGSQEEINKHKAKIEELTQTNKELAEYKELVITAIGIIKQKDLEIKKLNAQVEELREKAPSALSLALAGRLGQPSSSELLINILGRHKSREKNNE